MFTGIIEEVGVIRGIRQRGENRSITIAAKSALAGLRTGDSIAVSGVCLTALDIQPDSFRADLAPETWARTSFSRLTEGARVNLERSMAADGRFSGHIVQGHVDGVGKFVELERIPERAEGSKADSQNWWLHLDLPPEVERYTVHKGSIAIEGISLTVARLDGPHCSVAIIPHTVEMTNLGSLAPGAALNLEADLIAKYVEKMLRKPASNLGIEYLVKQGF